MVDVPKFIEEDLRKAVLNVGRLSGIVSELYELIVLQGDESLKNYWEGKISLEEAVKNSELMGNKLDWLDENLHNLKYILEKIEMGY